MCKTVTNVVEQTNFSRTPLKADGILTDDFELGEIIGTGFFSEVRAGKSKKTGEEVAVKIIHKPDVKKVHMLNTEVAIMQSVNHPNVVRTYQIYETEEKLCIVMERLRGGELFDRIIKKGHYSEKDARAVTVTLLQTVAYLHARGIVHRDLKPENLMLLDNSHDSPIKLTDFGLSKIMMENTTMKTACGTPSYVAPEVLMHSQYTEAVDLWSIGVIVYILLCGLMPFYGETDAIMFRRIKQGKFKFLSPHWDDISDDAKDFVSHLLKVSPTDRPSCKEALQHKWIQEGSSVSQVNLMVRPEKQALSLSDKLKNLQLAAKQSKPFLDPETCEILGLPTNTVLLQKYSASMQVIAGELYLTKASVCFKSYNHQIKHVWPFYEMANCAKARRFRFYLSTTSNSLTITLKSGKVYQINSFVGSARDDAIRDITAQAALSGVVFETPKGSGSRYGQGSRYGVGG